MGWFLMRKLAANLLSFAAYIEFDEVSVTVLAASFRAKSFSSSRDRSGV
jgi:hypothetical protein